MKYAGWGTKNETQPFTRSQYNNSYLKKSTNYNYETYLKKYVGFKTPKRKKSKNIKPLIW